MFEKSVVREAVREISAVFIGRESIAAELWRTYTVLGRFVLWWPSVLLYMIGLVIIILFCPLVFCIERIEHSVWFSALKQRVHRAFFIEKI